MSNIGITEKILTDEQWKALQYKNTKVKKAKTYGEIIGLLEAHKIKDYIFRKINGVETLLFPLKISHNGIEYALMIKITVPYICYYAKKGKGKNAQREKFYYEDVSWRVFWWYLKGKLEAIEYGVSDNMTEFMYNAFRVLPDGREISLTQIIAKNLNQIEQLALSDDIQRKTIELEPTRVVYQSGN